MPDSSTAELLDEALDTAAELDILEKATTTPDQEKSPDELFWLEDTDGHGTKQPWAQYDDETVKAYALFQFYCSLPRASRSYAAVDVHYDFSGTAGSYANKHEWGDRVLAWDAERDRLYQIEVIEEIQAMGRRQGEQLAQAISATSLPLATLAQKMEDDPEAIEAELSSKSITQLHAMSVKAARGLPNLMASERLARGLPTEITHTVHSGKIEHVHTPDLSEVTEILQGLIAAGSVELVGSTVIDIGEEADAEIELVSPDDTDDETDGLPSP